MQVFLNDLNQQIIISKEDIKMLKEDLLKQHPEYSNLQRAQLFSKMLHQILDQALYPFEGNLLRKIKYHLLRKNISQEIFSISALDIIKAYLQLGPETNNGLNPLCRWMKSHNLGELSSQQVKLLVHSEDTNCISASSLEQVKTVDFPDVSHLIRQNKWLIAISGCLLIVTAVGFSLNLNRKSAVALKDHFNDYADYAISLPISLELDKSANYLQENLQYKEINEVALKAWLENKHSLLVTEPYFSTLMDTAKSFNINPLLLFSITGQEQGFVPSSHPYALQMANNPFNLYGSWEDYNTSIKEAAKIAARTIIRLGKDCPEGEDQIKWINQSYAADPNWHIGVSYFLNELENATKLENTN